MSVAVISTMFSWEAPGGLSSMSPVGLSGFCFILASQAYREEIFEFSLENIWFILEGVVISTIGVGLESTLLGDKSTTVG